MGSLRRVSLSKFGVGELILKILKILKMTPQMENKPKSDEYLRAHTLGELTPLSGAILLVDYDPAWRRQFESEAARIRSALGKRALLLEHAGSTSVPGLVAKPIIDIVLAVADSAQETEYAPLLEETGYRLRIREPHDHEHRMFKGVTPDVNLHVYSAGCPEIDRMLAFRDRLRNDAADRELYARTKRQLAQRDWKYMQNYADAKSDVVAKILARAKF
jgi:GrpB-like predicted nucleotidyltransferase (UPF0157 family)